jgi:polar amino acid transport system substrate-binding protein
VDVYACNKAVGLFILVNRIQADADQVVYNPRPIFTETNHLILSRRLPYAEALMARFNEGLRKLRQSGRYDLIIRDYPGLN